MPPKKRGRPTGPASTLQRPTKRVRVGETSVIGTRSSTEVTESGRPKRNSTGELNYSLTRAKAPNAKAPASVLKTTTANQPNVTRKRKGASKLFGKRKISITTKARAEAEVEASKPKRGRPKAVSATAKAAVSNEDANIVKKAVGRPKKAVGRPKNDAKDVQSVKNPAAKQKAPKVSVGLKKTKQQLGNLSNVTPNDVDEDEETEVDESDRQYWLMKAEPESRMENGVDMKFSIDDLRDRRGAEAWDGVRNHAARNNMRAMRVGDLAFFYHSNCKVPGIAGVMQICAEHRVDETAFDPAHPSYDPKSSRDNPKWDLVDVTFIRKFPELVKLSELRSFNKPGGALENMQMLKQSRLSVSAVKPKEWAFILGLAGEEEEQVEEVQDDDDEQVDGEESGSAEDMVDGAAEDAVVNGDKDGSSMVNELVDDEAAVDGDLEDNEGEDDADDEAVGENEELVK